MSNNPQGPFHGLLLDEEEQRTEDAVARGEYVDSPDFKATKELIEEAAKRHIELNTAKPITLRIKQTDLIKIKAKAKRNGIPYQTLLSALLHDFAENRKELVIK